MIPNGESKELTAFHKEYFSPDDDAGSPIEAAWAAQNALQFQLWPLVGDAEKPPALFKTALERKILTTAEAEYLIACYEIGELEEFRWNESKLLVKVQELAYCRQIRRASRHKTAQAKIVYLCLCLFKSLKRRAGAEVPPDEHFSSDDYVFCRTEP